MKNRIASLLLVFALLLSLCGNAVARDNRIVIQSGGAERFTDVPTSHWAYSYINKVVGSGLFNGMTPTTFAPSDAMTRAQFVIVMSRMEGLNVERVETVTKFPDVPSTYWAAGAIAWATEAGIVGGFGDGTFKPTSPITRGQFAALIHRYIVSKRYVNLHVVDPEPAQFTDAASVSSAFTNDVEYARVHGLLTGYSDGTVRASNPITRAAIAAILARFLDLVQESGYTPLLDGPVIDGGDSGDSGTTPVETPTSYDAIKMSVLAGTHGTTAIASVTRNGEQVAADDVKQGDRVTITHKPESGYVASVRVRDANGKVVTVHKVDANTSWFEMPAAMPVTVTVTYSKESSGGGGGGSGGGGGNNNNNNSGTSYYYLTVTAATPVNGTVKFAQGDISGETSLDKVTLSDTLDKWWQIDNVNFTFSVVLTPNTGASIAADPVVTDGTKTYTATTTKTIGGSTVYVYTASNSTPSSGNNLNTLTITVTANFGGGSTTPADKWTFTATVAGGYVAIATDPSTFKAADITSGAKTSATSDETAKGTKLYVAFTRNDAESTGDPIVSPSTLTPNTANTVAGSLWVYEVTDTVKTVSASFKPINKVGATKDITVVATLDGATTAPADLPTPKAQVSGADATVAARGDTVTIVAPEVAGYGTGYHVKEVKVDPSTVTAEPQGANADGKIYTFPMPDSAVTVTVVYETNADESLSYAVTVGFEGTGTGSLSLNVAGKDYPLSNAANGQKTVDLTADGVAIPASKSEYVSLYGVSTDDKWSLPMYLASAPVASSDSLYNKITKDTNKLETSSKESTVALVAGETAELNVQFDKMQAYGYKLTVIGKGSVSGGTMAGKDMNGVSINKSIALSSSDGKPQTTTSGTVVMQSAPTITIPTPTANADGWALDSIQATYADGSEVPNAADALKNGFTPAQPGIVNIIVSFYDTNANPVGFNVTVNGTGSVNLKAENGVVLAGTFTDPAVAKNALAAERSKSNKQTTANPAAGYYYAASGTIITLTPASDSVKIKSIVIDGNNQIGDEMTTEGFSYTLPDVQPKTIDIVVTLAAFDSYTFTLQAPYGGALNAGMDFHSQSKGIKSEQLDTILYSLNDAFVDDGTGHSQVLTGFKQGKSGLDNNYGSTGAHLTQAIVHYLTKATKVNEDTGVPENGQQQLENKLNDIIEQQVKDNLDNIIKTQKDDMLSGTKRTDIENKIDSALNTALVNPASYSANITDETSKASIVQKIYEANPTAYSKNAADYTVTATVTPVLTDAQMTGLDSNKVKTIKAQLKSFIMDYLSNTLTIAPVSANTAKAHVNTVDTNNGTVRVSVEATLNGQPTVSSNFANLYKDKLVIWLRSDLSVTYNGTPVDLGSNVLDAFPITQVALSANDAAKVDSDLVGQLGAVDTTVNTEWSSALDNIMNKNTNAVYVSMGSILTKDMLDSVVEGSKNDSKDSALKTVIEKITDKVESVQPGTNTETAFMNVYRDFVVFNKGQSDLITLKSKDGDTTSTVLGRIVPNSKYDGANAKGDCLELLLDFDNILADKKADNNAPFEKVVDLMIALRDGFATDVRLNAEKSTSEATKGQTAESVISGLIWNQIDRDGVELTANKWGTLIGSNGVRALNATEKKELCDLAAKLIMTPLTEKLDTAWKDFEKQGYQSVSIALNVDSNNRTSLKQLVESLNSDLAGRSGKTDITIGVSVEEVLK